MNTDSIIKSSVRFSVELEGQPPIYSSRLSWETGNDSNIPHANSGGEVFCKRIRYADLTTVSTDRVFQILYANGDFDEQKGVQNIEGVYFDLETPLGLIYINSNIAVSVTSLFSIPSDITDGGTFLHAGSAVATDSYADSDPMVTLTWDNSAILAIGSDNFYCDLILANA